VSQRAIIKDDVRYLLFSEIYLRYDEPKTKRKAYSLLEAAIQCFDKKGFEDTTMEMIAREAGVTRPLLRHYFKDTRDLRETALKYMRLILQRVAVEAMLKSERPDEMLHLYLEACFTWARTYKVHRRVWLGFLASCGRRTSDRELNTQAVNTGTDRIVQLLKAGKDAGLFQFEDEHIAARLIQITILGALVTTTSENIDETEPLERAVIRQCLAIAGARISYNRD
jgi:AcrR family transcriptional regulator